MPDAISAGALVVGSRTPLVKEVVEDGRNDVLRDVFDLGRIADAVMDALANLGRQGSRMKSRLWNSPV